MSVDPATPQTSEALLTYRPWRGELRSSWLSIWPIARTSLGMLLRRKLFWILYALALFIFFMFFFGQYMLFWAESQTAQSSVRFLGRNTSPAMLIKTFREKLKLNGSGETYRNFFHYQGYMLMVILALGGSLLIGNDFRHSSLPFYLSKPISSTHYMLGKCLALGILINLTTTLPALLLFFQYGILSTESYFPYHWELFLGIVGFGIVLTIVLSLLLMATAVRLRNTVPLIMTWTTLFFFCRRLARALVFRLDLPPEWRLIDLWNNLFLIGNRLMGVETSSRYQPSLLYGILVLTTVSLVCLLYLSRRIRAVEIAN